MKARIGYYIAVVLLSLSVEPPGYGQGFINLGFESANPSGYSPGVDTLPTTRAFPGWSVSYSSPGVGTNSPVTVWYASGSLGGAFISVNDSNSPPGFGPVQGRYSAYLFGGPSAYFSEHGDPTYVTLSQTGLVPSGTETVLMDVKAGNGFTVTLGGQMINMLPLQSSPTYTTYGGNVSAFAGLVAQLNVTAPPTGVPNSVLLDNIRFSSQLVPEPGPIVLLVLGIGFVVGKAGRRQVLSR
jgi:hypothetical protein